MEQKNILLYEEEYKNRERNEKGKVCDYFNGKLKFEGERKIYKRRGMGKECNDEGYFIFEEEY